MKDRTFSIWFAICAVGAVAFWVTVAIVAWHFLAKVW